MAFKVEMQYSDGSSELDDDVFETEGEAERHGGYLLSCHRLGAEILHESNPGDYTDPADVADPSFRVVEVDG